MTATPIDTTPPAAPLGVKDGEEGERDPDHVEDEYGAGPFGLQCVQVSSGRTEKLNREPVKEPEYLDTQVPDVRYVSYYVTALERSGNESEKSKESIIILMKE